ncbi:unnamed protein product [Hermetia illucens]|uniref:Uncharacterized protein n=1 Tax=Hermetia illucens TaxID=343691 RepID=A0A7R8V320_HERIL|nr:unnamed protein product [Hermetia illucens]
MLRRTFGVLLIGLILTASIDRGLCGDSSKEKKDDGENGSSLGDILRNVGSSIQEGAKKVGQTFQKGYEYVKKKVSEIGDDDDKPKDQDSKVELPKEQSSVTDAEKKEESDKKPGTNVTVDDRFLFDTPQKCPDGQQLDHSNQCRSG